MASVRFLSYATKLNVETSYLRDSAELFGFDLTFMGVGKEWIGLNQKLHAVQEALTGMAPDSLIGFVDGYDTCFVRDSSEFLEEYGNLGHPLIMSAENNCCPILSYEGRLPYPNCRYPYVNSGCWFGQVGAVRTWLREMNIARLPITGNDQEFTTDYYYKYPERIRLDHRAALFQSLFGVESDVDYSEVVVNKLTGTSPFVIHANGKSSMTQVHTWLDRRI